MSNSTCFCLFIAVIVNAVIVALGSAVIAVVIAVVTTAVANADYQYDDAKTAGAYGPVNAVCYSYDIASFAAVSPARPPAAAPLPRLSFSLLYKTL